MVKIYKADLEKTESFIVQAPADARWLYARIQAREIDTDDLDIESVKDAYIESINRGIQGYTEFPVAWFETESDVDDAFWAFKSVPTGKNAPDSSEFRPLGVLQFSGLEKEAVYHIYVARQPITKIVSDPEEII